MTATEFVYFWIQLPQEIILLLALGNSTVHEGLALGLKEKSERDTSGVEWPRPAMKLNHIHDGESELIWQLLPASENRK